MQSLRGSLLFGAVLLLLILTLYGSFAFQGAAAWSIGLVYISYDSLLLGFMIVSSTRAVRRERQAATRADSFLLAPKPSLTVLICARNEHAVLPDCLTKLLTQDDPADEILILDDGSTDAMVPWLTKAFALDFQPLEAGRLGTSKTSSALRVLTKPNTGKADSLNLGWRLARSRIIVTLDADTYLEPGALGALRRAFAADPELGIAGGVLLPVCARTRAAGFFQFFQTFEYARGFLWRLTFMQYDMLLLISGAFAAYRRDVLETVGGFDTKSWVEDYELTHRVYRDAYDRGRRVSVQTISGARGTTDAPATARTFLNQRRRWFAGFIATHFKYNAMVGNPRYGAVGRYMLSLKTLDLLLPVYALAAAVVLVMLLIVRHHLAPIIIKLIIAKLIFDLVLHAYSLVIYRRWLRLPRGQCLWLKSLGATLTEPFAFQILRQLGAVIGWLAFLRGRVDWMEQRKAGQ